MSAPSPTPARAAAVDVGSNSVRLLVVDGDGTRVLRHITTTRLAAGVDATGYLDDAAIARTIAALRTFRTAWETAGVPLERVRITATSAVRDAVDRERFLAAVQRAIGVRVEVITGGDEAALSFAGATGAVDVASPCVVIDVGGGSTELVVGDAQGAIVGSVSLQLGCVRLTERDLPSDPAEPEELTQAARTVDGLVADGLASLAAQGVDVSRLVSAVGVAGTATTLAALHLGLDTYEEERIHGTVVPVDELELHAGRERRPAGLGAREVRRAFDEHEVTRRGMGRDSDQVAHQARREEHGRLLPEQRGDALAQRGHGRVEALLLVADRRGGDRRTHRVGGPRLRVGGQVHELGARRVAARVAARVTHRVTHRLAHRSHTCAAVARHRGPLARMHAVRQRAPRR